MIPKVGIAREEHIHCHLATSHSLRFTFHVFCSAAETIHEHVSLSRSDGRVSIPWRRRSVLTRTLSARQQHWNSTAPLNAQDNLTSLDRQVDEPGDSLTPLR